MNYHEWNAGNWLNEIDNRSEEVSHIIILQSVIYNNNNNNNLIYEAPYGGNFRGAGA